MYTIAVAMHMHMGRSVLLYSLEIISTRQMKRSW